MEPPILRVGMPVEPKTLDWQAAATPEDRFFARFLMTGMMRFEEGGAAQCALCTHVDRLQQGRLYRFELKPDVKWSDGVKLEARHFVAAFERLATDPRLAGLRRPFAGIRPHGVRALAPSRLEIELTRADASFLALMSLPAAFPIRGRPPSDPAGQPVLGPYIPAAWERGSRLVIEGNPEFSGPRPVYRVDFMFGELSSLSKRFRSGRIDLLTNPTTEQLAALMGEGESNRVQVSPYWATHLLIPRCDRGPLASEDLRRALVAALPRELVPSVLRGGERATTGLMPPGLKGSRSLPLVTQDLERARVLVAAVRASLKDPQAALRLTLLYDGQEEVQKRLSGWITEQLSRIGVDVVAVAASGAVLKRRMARGEFDLLLSTYAFETGEPLEVLRRFRTTAAENVGRFSQVGFDAFLTQLEHGITEGTRPRTQLLEQTLNLLEAQEVGVIPLGYPSLASLLGARVTTFTVTPFGEPDLIRITLAR